MPGITRRNLLRSGLALSASSVMPRASWARSAALLEGRPEVTLPATPSAVAPRAQLLFDFGWKFTFGNGDDPTRIWVSATARATLPRPATSNSPRQVRRLQWRTLNLPHDWAVELPFVHDDGAQKLARI